MVIAKPFQLQMLFLRLRNQNRSKFLSKYHPNPILLLLTQKAHGLFQCQILSANQYVHPNERKILSILEIYTYPFKSRRSLTSSWNKLATPHFASRIQIRIILTTISSQNIIRMGFDWRKSPKQKFKFQPYQHLRWI